MSNKLFTNKQLIRLIFPLIVEQLLATLVGMFDTVMVSSVGEAAISGVSLMNDLNNLMIQLLAALAGGGAVCVSQYLGHQDEENTRRSSSQLVMISFLISMGLAIFCLIFHRAILKMLYGSVEPDVMQAAATYFWITALSFPFLGMYNSAAALYRVMNLTKATMYVSMVVNLINLVGNYVGIYIFKLGVVGVALPTVISRAAGALIMITMVFKADHAVSVSFKRIFQWNKDILSKILTIAIPNGVENGLFQLGKVLVSAIVASYGTSQIAANGVTNSISVLCYTTEFAINLSVTTVIGRCVGANDYKQATYYIKKMVLWAYVMCLANNLIMLGCSKYALALFTLSDEAMQIAKTILFMECFALIVLHPLAFPLPYCLRAAGDAKYTMVVGVTSMFIARVTGAYVLGTVFGLGVVGTRIGMYLDWGVRIIFFVHRYFSGKWKNYRII